MKLVTTVMLGLIAMAATSATVWTATAPTPATPDAPIVARADSQVAPTPAVGHAPRDDVPQDPSTPAPAQPDPMLAEFQAEGTLAIHGSVGHTALWAASPGETYVFIDINASTGGAAEVRAPVDLTLAVDHSGSMQGDRLRNALAAARGMIERLRDGDSVSVVAFSGNAQVLLPPTTVTPETRARAIAGLLGFRPSGHTCMSCGIETGLELLRRRAGTIDRLVLLTDGEANRGVSDIPGLRSMAARARQAGVSISTLGVSADYNEDALSAISKESSGHHYFIQHPDQLAPVFAAEFSSLVKTVAQDATLTLDLAPGVELVEVFDRNTRRSGTRVSVPLGTFTAGEQKTLLVKVQLPAGVAGPRDVAEVALHYSDVTSKTPAQARGMLAVNLVDERDRVTQLDARVLGRLTRTETVRTLDEAGSLFDNGDTSAASTRLTRQLSAVREQKKRHELRVAAGELAEDSPSPVAGQEEALEEAIDSLERQVKVEKDHAKQVQSGAAAPSSKPKRTLRKVGFDAADPFG